MVMHITMHYGKTGLPLEFPDAWDITIIRKKPMPSIQNPEISLKSAFENPTGGHPLTELSRKCNNACILICDITRPVPNGVILPTLIRQLIDGGIKPSNILILVATGLHRPNEGQELLEIVNSKWVMDTVKIQNHFARRDEDHEDFGKTSRGTVIKLDRRFVHANLRIVVGLVEPHFMAGYSGGRKMVAPGIAHRDTITSIHSAGMLEQKGVENCTIEENPLHQELTEIVKKVGECFAVNVVIDEERKISFLNFGDIENSHREAVTFVRSFAEIPVTQRFKTVVTSGAGYPLDKNYYQTVKGMVAAIDILEPGGNLFIVSECSEGIGSPEFVECQRRLIEFGPEAFMKEILSKTMADIDEWETQMQLKVAKVGRIHLYSGCLCDEDMRLTGVEPVQSVMDAVQRSMDTFRDNRVAVIPEGPYVIPRRNAAR
ncbi:MAG: nickel-dependent lactate racemase [Syntrophorhabdus sp.]